MMNRDCRGSRTLYTNISDLVAGNEIKFNDGSRSPQAAEKFIAINELDILVGTCMSRTMFLGHCSLSKLSMKIGHHQALVTRT